MIRYHLVCQEGHEFESWFPSSDSYDAQVQRGLVACPTCNSVKVSKALMTPQVARKDRDDPALVAAREQEMRKRIKALRDVIVANSDNVGDRFAEEARKIHHGESEERPIIGTTTVAEAKELIEEEIAILPLPELPDELN